MKFSEMKYERPDLEAVKKQYTDLAARLGASASYEEARKVFVEEDTFSKHINTLSTICEIRNSIDTRDEFYDAEKNFWNSAEPELMEYEKRWTETLLSSPFRKDVEKEFGKIIFTNAELELKSFRPEIIPELQRENELVQEYAKLIASARIPFMGEIYTVS